MLNRAPMKTKNRVESIEISNDDLARQLIDAALINDENWTK